MNPAPPREYPRLSVNDRITRLAFALAIAVMIACVAIMFWQRSFSLMETTLAVAVVAAILNAMRQSQGLIDSRLLHERPTQFSNTIVFSGIAAAGVANFVFREPSLGFTIIILTSVIAIIGGVWRQVQLWRFRQFVRSADGLLCTHCRYPGMRPRVLV